MNLFHHIIEFIFGSALLINAFLFIPQIIRILKTRSSQGVSFVTFFGFLLIQLAVVLHGILHRDTILIWGYSLSMLVCGVVVALILYYRSKSSTHKTLDFETVLEQLPGHIYWKDRKGAMLYCNRNNWESFGLKSFSEYQGKTDYEVFPKDVADMLWHTDEEIMRTGMIKIVEEIDPNAEGGSRVYLSHKAPLRNRKQEIVGVSGVSVDITETKKTNLDRLDLL